MFGKKQIFKSLKILNINCQSIVNTAEEFQCLVDREKPDFVVGTESWLCSDISDSQVFPYGYMAYRADRKSKTIRSGVFILVRNSLICTEQPDFQTNCELIWIKLEVVGAQPLFIGAYYKPKEDYMDSLVEFRQSLEQISKKKGNIWLLGDFNMPKLNWPDCPLVFKGDPSCRQVYEFFTGYYKRFQFLSDGHRTHPQGKYFGPLSYHKSHS